MATILKGKRKGQKVKLHQWCNDWFSTDDGAILSPTNLELTDQEYFLVMSQKNNGIMFDLFERKVTNTGIRFKRVRRGK